MIDRILTALQSEHCSYKSTRKYLSALHTKGPHVIQGPGENAGIIDIGNGYAIALRIESHNHPSFISPYEGAATGVGGILRDIFTMGARPIALLDFLRFEETDKGCALLKEVVRGISDYGNTTGIPVVGGDLVFHPSYRNNCLVNVCALGLVKIENIIYGRAMHEGNPLIYVGGRTGRDGIGGSEMASKSLVDMDASAIQSSDPFLEKLLIEACCELAETDWVEGMQDMGAAGLLCSTTEVVHRGRLHSNKNLGCFVDLDRVPLKSKTMDLADILLSESQERMLIVGKKEHTQDILDLFNKWDLQGCVIGEIRNGGKYHVEYKDTKMVVDFDKLFEDIEEDWPLVESKRNHAPAFDGHLSQIENIIHQYDYMIGGRTIKGPDAPGRYAILDIPEADNQLVISWGTGAKLWSQDSGADPKVYIRSCFHKCLDSMQTLSAKPLAITNCMNFGHPENVIKDFKETIEGLNALCALYDIPIVSGNVSLYNCSETTSIEPTPIIIMIGTRPKLVSGIG